MVVQDGGPRARPQSSVPAFVLSVLGWGVGLLAAASLTLQGDCRCVFFPESSLAFSPESHFGGKVVWLGMVVGDVQGAGWPWDR